MRAEIINTGTELLLGRIANSHQQWLGRQLSGLGYRVQRQATVPDDSAAIETAVREALLRADLVITTGGLGPTGDDLTRERLAALLGRRLLHDPAVERQIIEFFTSRQRAVPRRCLVEALVPEGARVLPNHHGTAPGLALRLENFPGRADRGAAWLVMLPGPPRELHPMFTDQATPLLLREAPPTDPPLRRVLKTTGLGESLLEERLLAPLEPLGARGLELGFCARVGEVEVRLSARGPEAPALLAEAERLTREAVGEFIYGDEDDTLESVIVQALTTRSLTLALAESCTGGHLANRITNVPGASAILLAGLVTYSNQAKVRLLGVDPAALEAHGAVSEPVARQMAEGARRVTGADYAVAVTGVAGPGGGTGTKPVGTVFLAVTGPNGTEAWRELNRFDRETFKFVTAQQALDRLRRTVQTRPHVP